MYKMLVATIAAHLLHSHLRCSRSSSLLRLLLYFSLLLQILNSKSPLLVNCLSQTDFNFRQCEPIRFELCRGIGYNETSMPNLVGHELQADVEFTLQTFTPLIDYVCSTQLKLFLCAAYVPMCTPKVPVPIGPCRSLCESVRSRCHPVLQGFGFPWPPALDCNRFPKQNNHETMCMEGPGESHIPVQDSANDIYGSVGVGIGIGGAALGGVVGNGLLLAKTTTTLGGGIGTTLDCPGITKSHLYVKLLRLGRCAPLCEADILFGQHEKHLADIWVATWTYAALGLAIIATLCLILSDDSKTSTKWSYMLTPLVWCHDMVAVGWTVRFVSGRIATSCGFDPQIPNVSLLLVDGLSNASCAATFLLRYYFGMAACVWWAILCLGWHRDVRRHSPDMHGHIMLRTTYDVSTQNTKQRKRGAATTSAAAAAATAAAIAATTATTSAAVNNRDYNVTQSNLARFAAWGLPGFQTAAVIVARLVDADELLGACFVGNQSDKGLQILVATPLFCYWIFGSVNLISGYLVHRRNKKILQSTNSQPLHQQLQMKSNNNSGIGTFLFIYWIPCGLLLFAVIYEFTNIDIWLNEPAYITANRGISTPLWPFLTRAFMELMLGIICSSWVLGPKISTLYKRQITPRTFKSATAAVTSSAVAGIMNSVGNGVGGGVGIGIGIGSAPSVSNNQRNANIAYSTVSYQSVHGGGGGSGVGIKKHIKVLPSTSGTISLNQMSNYSMGRASKCPQFSQLNLSHCNYKRAAATAATAAPAMTTQFQRYGNETIL